MTESQENLVEDGRPVTPSQAPEEPTPETSLTPAEKMFLMYAERGDCASLRRYTKATLFT